MEKKRDKNRIEGRRREEGEKKNSRKEAREGTKRIYGKIDTRANRFFYFFL
jgi:hypothetical protein